MRRAAALVYHDAMRALLVLLAVAWAAAAGAGELVGVAAVVDGDTIEVDRIPVRLAGIDAPEADQPGGAAAAAALRLLVEGEAVRCETDGVDRYRRIVARCWVGEVELNRRLVRHGWALDYARYSGGRYADDQAEAAAAGAGLWAAGQPEPPWEWRARERLKNR